ALGDEEIALVGALEPRRLVRVAIGLDARDRGERRLEPGIVPRHEHPVAGLVPPDVDVPPFERAEHLVAVEARERAAGPLEQPRERLLRRRRAGLVAAD